MRDMALRFSLQHLIRFFIRAVLGLELAYSLLSGHWLNAASALGILAIVLSPLLLKRWFRLSIPIEFELIGVVFVFATLFLGEMRGYYTKIWWWDIALHTGSGLALGLVGFLLVYVLNESTDVHLEMTAGFVALFSFQFAVSLGALWEIFEYGMDVLVGTTMQKPMLDDPSGLTDTMWDLIVNTVGASVISLLGYVYLSRGRKDSFIERWIDTFIQKNPQLFEKR